VTFDTGGTIFELKAVKIQHTHDRRKKNSQLGLRHAISVE